MEDNSSNSVHLSLHYAAASPSWVKPNDVMKTRKLKARRHALKARFISSSPIQSKYSKTVKSPSSSNFSKKNPFKCTQARDDNLRHQNSFSENSNDCSLFNLLLTQNEPRKSNSEEPYSFSKILADTENKKNVQEKSFVKYADTLAMDWSLKSRIRFLSTKPIQWKHTFKTSEEASGTTGFVRCLNSETEMREGRTLDTSANAQFYQCCLVWQHPNLPLVTLFPREKQKLTGPIGIYGSDQKIMKSLHSEWGDSLRSLYQLLRVRQCPFFYVCGHSFTCLFRATGAAGLSQTHALITPTTRGFRNALETEGVEFLMPLLEKNQSEEITDADETDNLSEEIDNSEEPTEFLETLGVAASQFPSLNQSRVKTEGKKFQTIDGSPQSLVFVEDLDLHGLVNFILNCGSCVTTTGALAGVPPTLLSPVAFHGGCLKSLKVNSSTIRSANGDSEFCVDIQGPILPTSVLHLSSLLASSQESYAASLTPLVSNLPFCYVTPSIIGTPMPMAFASEGLVDCGLGKEVREELCKGSNDSSSDLPPTYRHINFDDGRYTWSDKL